MPTKQELEQKIALLEKTIWEQKRLLEEISSKKGVCVVLPWAPHAAEHGDVPYIKLGDERGDVWSQKVMPIFTAAISKHGTPWSTPGATSVGELNLCEGCGGEAYIIPLIAAELLKDLMLAAGDYARRAYAEGVSVGQDLLVQLANSKVSNEDFEDRIAREKAQDVQGDKRFRIRKYDKRK